MIHVPNLKRPLTALVEFYADSDTDSDSDVEEINFEWCEWLWFYVGLIVWLLSF